MIHLCITFLLDSHLIYFTLHQMQIFFALKLKVLCNHINVQVNSRHLIKMTIDRANNLFTTLYISFNFLIHCNFARIGHLGSI